MQGVRIIEIPDCKMVSSGTGMFGEEKFERFNKWFSALPAGVYPKDYLYWDGEGFCWLYTYENGMNVPEEFEITNFKGGLYAVVTDIDGRTDMNALSAEVDEFLSENGLERDKSRFDLGNIITSHSAYKILGYHQMDYYAPVKEK